MFRLQSFTEQSFQQYLLIATRAQFPQQYLSKPTVAALYYNCYTAAMRIISVAFVFTGLLTIALASPLRNGESEERDALLQMLLRNALIDGMYKLHNNIIMVDLRLYLHQLD